METVHAINDQKYRINVMLVRTISYNIFFKCIENTSIKEMFAFKHSRPHANIKPKS